MYLSVMNVNILGDPNLPRYGRAWLKNPYHVHQRLSMAFGDMQKDSRGQRDARSAERVNFLYRADAARIIVLSGQKPDWERTFARATYLLADEKLPETRPFTLPIEKGQRLRFLLRANPTRKARSCIRDGQRVKIESKHGKRTALVSREDQLAWLQRKGLDCGFAIVEDSDPDFGLQIIDEGWVHARKTTPGDAAHAASENDDAGLESQRKGSGLSFRSVRFSGELTVSDPELLRQRIPAGIGSGKAFGFGLLSVARASS
jgi:CRISPR system Cascade subunit CasE